MTWSWNTREYLPNGSGRYWHRICKRGDLDIQCEIVHFVYDLENPVVRSDGWTMWHSESLWVVSQLSTEREYILPLEGYKDGWFVMGQKFEKLEDAVAVIQARGFNRQ